MGSGATAELALDEVFMALADPIRRAILARLSNGDANVTELAEPFNVSQPAVSKHLKVLERAGLISRHRAATARYCHLEARSLEKANLWLEQYRQYWDESYQRLDEVLREESRKTNNTKRVGRKHG